MNRPSTHKIPQDLPDHKSPNDGGDPGQIGATGALPGSPLLSTLPELLTRLRRVRNRLGRNTRDLDWTLALAELQRLPPGQIRIIRTALATNKRLFTSIRRIQTRLAHKHKQQP